jgi:hypothetical protein
MQGWHIASPLLIRRSFRSARRTVANSGSLRDTPVASNAINEFAIAGKMPPSPSSPLKRFLVNAIALSMALWREAFGMIGSAARSTRSRARNASPTSAPVGLRR